MARVGLAAAGLLALALVVFFFGGFDAEPRATVREAPAASGPAPETASLLAALEDERRERLRLEEEIARLSERVAALEPASGAEPLADAPDPASESVADAGGGEEEPRPEELEARWSDSALLDAVGLHPEDAAALRRLFEEIELERLYVRDAAQREGWPPQQLRRELRGLDVQLRGVRDEWGDPIYDWMLYASGARNRVVVESVLGGSAAADAGVRGGDVLLSYDGRRIFSPVELRMQTNAGSLGETVMVEVGRGASVQRVRVPRGPLGVRLDAISATPGPP